MTIDGLIRKWRQGKTTEQEYKLLLKELDILVMRLILCGNGKQAKRYSRVYKQVLSKGN